MLKLSEFILLKAIFNEDLHNAVLEKDKQKISNIVEDKYAYELENGFVDGEEEIDTEQLFEKHNEQLKNDDFKWAY